MSVRKRPNGKYTIDYRVGGQRVRETWPTRAMASERMHEVALRRSRGARPVTANVSVDEIMARYIEWLRVQDRSAGYIAQYQSVRRRCAPIMMLQVRRLNKALYDRWVAERRAAGVGQQPVISEYRVLHAALEYAVSREIISENPLAKYKLAARKPRMPYVPTPEELQRIFDALRGRDAHQTHDARRLVYFALATGARLNEIITLRAENVSGNVVTIVGKGGWERRFELPPLPFDLPGAGFLFTLGHKHWTHRTALDKIHAACTAAGLQRMKFHTLRHAHATYECANGTTIRELMVRCGWRSLSVMQRYLDISRTIKPGPYLPNFLSARTPTGHIEEQPSTQIAI
jgi:integrase/recombinase XerD